METHLMLGNEAVARGAWEAGVQVAAAYPGTPSTEIVTSLARYDGVYAEWSTNEKVAYEVAFGAAMGGARALTAMKSAGGSVAADPLISSVYTGVNGGLVVCLAGDPGMSSGMTEQDDRYFGRISSMPMLEPADSQECYEYAKRAFGMSEEFDVPVMVRLSIQTAHQKSIVRFDGEVAAGDADGGGDGEDPAGLRRPAPERRPPDRKTEKYCLLPRFSRPLHRSLLERVERLREYAEATAASGELARSRARRRGDGGAPRRRGAAAGRRHGENRRGLRRGGVHQRQGGAARRRLPQARHDPPAAGRGRAPLRGDRRPACSSSRSSSRTWRSRLLAAGIACEGKQWFPPWGELTAVRVGRGFYAAGLELPRWAEEKAAEDDSVIPRPPVLCTGCPHRGMATAMKKLNLDVHGDIGCYDLTTLPPVSHMHSAVEMGASIPMEQGFQRAGGSETGSIAVIGDSTFLHSGLTGLLNAVHQRTNITLLIQDNRITAMTGGQTNPGNERTLAGAETKPVDIAAICKALGVEQIEIVDPYDYEACLTALKAGLAYDGPAVIITNRPCMLFPSKIDGEAFAVDEDVCNACQQCMKLGCPSLSHTERRAQGPPQGEDRRGDLHRLLAVSSSSASRARSRRRSGVV